MEAAKQEQEAIERTFSPVPIGRTKAQSSKRPQKTGDATTVATHGAASANGTSSNDTRTRQIFGNRAPLLLKCLNKLKNHHEIGSICACAEPNAIAQLLEAQRPSFSTPGTCSSWLRDVRVKKTSLIGELIEPCKNCSQWLAPTDNRSYKINEYILGEIDNLEQQRLKSQSKPSTSHVPLTTANPFDVLKNLDK